MDPWESKPGPVFPLQMLTEVQPVLDSGAKWGWGARLSWWLSLGTLVSAAVLSPLQWAVSKVWKGQGASGGGAVSQ